MTSHPTERTDDGGTPHLRTSFASIHPLYVTQAERKGHTEAEVDQDIENPLMQQVRSLDKLVDELASGRRMTAILRGSSATTS